MDIQQEIIDEVIYNGGWNTIRGLIAEHGLCGTIQREDFTGAAFWCSNGHQYALAYSNEVMVLNKDGNLHGVAAYNAAVIPVGKEDGFSKGEGSLPLAEGIL